MGTNTPAYFSGASVTKKKSVLALALARIDFSRVSSKRDLTFPEHTLGRKAIIEFLNVS